LAPEQIESFHRDGCVTIENVLTEDEIAEIQDIFDRFINGEISVPGKDFCDMSKPFGIPYEEWSIVNCMLPTKYYPPLKGNIFERLTDSIAQQLFPVSDMVKDYDQLLNKRPGKSDAVFAWHQDMAYWPGPAALGVDNTDTCTFSLAIDDSDKDNGCLRYVVGSGVSRTIRPHKPLAGNTREESHALCAEVDENSEEIRLAPAKRGSLTIHNEVSSFWNCCISRCFLTYRQEKDLLTTDLFCLLQYVVHGSGGNICADRQRRTYVLAYRAHETVRAERLIGFTHSHNDEVNWDTFDDGESHRVNSQSVHED